MPLARLKADYQQLGNNPAEEMIVKLANRWGVSLQALKIRLKIS